MLGGSRHYWDGADGAAWVSRAGMAAFGASTPVFLAIAWPWRARSGEPGLRMTQRQATAGAAGGQAGAATGSKLGGRPHSRCAHVYSTRGGGAKAPRANAGLRRDDARLAVL